MTDVVVKVNYYMHMHSAKFSNVTFVVLEIESRIWKCLLQVLLIGKDDPPIGCTFENVNENLVIYLEVRGKVDLEGELEKIRNKMEDTQK